LARLLEAGLLTMGQHNSAIGAARGMFFKDRTWPRIFDAVAIDSVAAGRHAAWLTADGPTLKTRDALLLLDAMSLPQTPRSKSGFVSTRLFDQLRLRL
jgi:hypothetical protein